MVGLGEEQLSILESPATEAKENNKKKHHVPD
jgi:hypothetical protein